MISVTLKYPAGHVVNLARIPSRAHLKRASISVARTPIG